MRLRNWKETVEPTIEETLADVHPRTLEEPFGYYAIVGSRCWVKWPTDGKWRHGTVVGGGYNIRIYEHGYGRVFEVGIQSKRQCVVEEFAPEEGTMKPDTPEVRELIRQAGYFTP